MLESYLGFYLFRTSKRRFFDKIVLVYTLRRDVTFRIYKMILHHFINSIMLNYSSFLVIYLHIYNKQFIIIFIFDNLFTYEYLHLL